jgi:hypothetical protein
MHMQVLIGFDGHYPSARMRSDSTMVQDAVDSESTSSCEGRSDEVRSFLRAAFFSSTEVSG